MKTRLATRREQSGRWHPPPVWFARDQNRPLTFFAGLWTRWTSGRFGRVGSGNVRGGSCICEPRPRTAGPAHRVLEHKAHVQVVVVWIV
jgi:putative SOS response-associated peptidase YedK